MATSPEFRAFIVEQLSRVRPVTARSMFGGAGLYADGLIFGLIAGDQVYFKVDDASRADYEAAGRGAFQPYGDGRSMMSYYELPDGLLESPDELRLWMERAIEASRAARRNRRR
jgi:DNA transformation protein